MDERQKHILRLRGTDVEGALDRFCGDEALYATCLIRFLGDDTMPALNAAVASANWDDAFTAAHALKGLAGNLGFVPLMHATGQMVVLIRGGRLRELPECALQDNSSYRDVTDAIRIGLADVIE